MTITVERQISSPFVRDIIDYWSMLRGDRPAPQVHEVDPLNIPRTSLPHVILADLHPRPFRIKYRLVGTHITNLVGGDFKGRFLDELSLPHGIDALLTEDYARTAWTCQPILGTYPWPKTDGHYATVQYALLPLLDGDRVTRFLCGEHIDDKEKGSYLYAEDLVKTPWRETAA